MPRPVLYVLAGVNGAGKSSVGGHGLTRAGLAWFNPDAFAHAWMAATGCAPADANATAWTEGMRRLDAAIAQGQSFAFETTLGGRSVPARIRHASRTHEVLVWFCGLATPEQHLERVRQRVAAGGHDIPEAKVRERWHSAIANLIALCPIWPKRACSTTAPAWRRARPCPTRCRWLSFKTAGWCGRHPTTPRNWPARPTGPSRCWRPR